MKNRFISKVPDSGRFTISPKEAEFLLTQYNSENRAPTPSRASKYAEEMEGGYWVLGQSICIRHDGVLQDGQNRLRGVVISNKPLDTFVNYGLPEKSFHKMDIHKKRTPKDTWGLGNVSPKINQYAPSIANNWYRADNNWIASGRVIEDVSRQLYFDNQEHIDFVASNSSTSKGLRRIGFLVAISQYMAKEPLKARELYLKVISDGAGLTSGNAALALRNYLLSSSGGGDAQIKSDYWATVTAIHKYHFNTPAIKLNQKLDKWQF